MSVTTAPSPTPARANQGSSTETGSPSTTTSSAWRAARTGAQSSTTAANGAERSSQSATRAVATAAATPSCSTGSAPSSPHRLERHHHEQLQVRPYGGDAAADGPVAARFRYTGAYSTSLTAYKMDERWYDPAIGRWLQQDLVTIHLLTAAGTAMALLVETLSTMWTDPGYKDVLSGSLLPGA
jgi:RHS repeat-associated protein